MAVTFDPATVTAVTLSNGNLTATNTGTTSADQGAKVASVFGQTAGKFYFEMTWTTTAGGNYGAGVGTTAATYTNMGNSATGGVAVFRGAGNVWVNGTNTLSIGTLANGDVIGIAVDLDNRKAWFKKVSGTPSAWNAASGGSNDPATNVGGVTILSGTIVPIATFGGASGTANNVQTANFGASAFTGSVPSGFTSGWPDNFVPFNPWPQAAPILAM